ncbi:MAG TPA: PHP domain-containing protein, partial [Anaerolineae bacterium]|nr:PHP domain-containing protein [Anaerolineae bacterium]
MHAIPLHLHSHWSLLDGVPSVRESVDFVQALGLPAFALTDTNALYGAVEFASRCRDAGIRPIIGAELTVAGGHSVVFLAQDREGYANLCHLVTRLQAAPDREASLARGLALSDLDGHTHGLIALSGGCAGLLDAALREGDGQRAESLVQDFTNLFGRDRFFVELQIIEAGDGAKAAVLHSLAGRMGVRTVATHDIRYLSPGDAPRYRVLAAMRQSQSLKDLPSMPDLSFPVPEDMQRRFRDFPTALDNTNLVAEMCRFDLPLGELHFPTLDLPPGRAPRDELWTLALAGAMQRYGE